MKINKLIEFSENNFDTHINVLTHFRSEKKSLINSNAKKS